MSTFSPTQKTDSFKDNIFEILCLLTITLAPIILYFLFDILLPAFKGIRIAWFACAFVFIFIDFTIISIQMSSVVRNTFKSLEEPYKSIFQIFLLFVSILGPFSVFFAENMINYCYRIRYFHIPDALIATSSICLIVALYINFILIWKWLYSADNARSTEELKVRRVISYQFVVLGVTIVNVSIQATIIWDIMPLLLEIFFLTKWSLRTDGDFNTVLKGILINNPFHRIKCSITSSDRLAKSFDNMSMGIDKHFKIKGIDFVCHISEPKGGIQTVTTNTPITNKQYCVLTGYTFVAAHFCNNDFHLFAENEIEAFDEVLKKFSASGIDGYSDSGEPVKAIKVTRDVKDRPKENNVWYKYYKDIVEGHYEWNHCGSFDCVGVTPQRIIEYEEEMKSQGHYVPRHVDEGWYRFGDGKSGSLYLDVTFVALKPKPIVNKKSICPSMSNNILTIKVDTVSFDMVLVKAGTFMMMEKEQVTIPNDYYIGKTVVTQALWQAVMGSKPYNFKGDNKPVSVSDWNDYQTFISKLNSLTGKTFRLPTEVEWEFAARGGNSSKGYIYSGSNYLCDVGWCEYNSNNIAHDVAKKQANELGIYDMSGNVFEMCLYRRGNSQRNLTGPIDNGKHIMRGGGCGCSSYCCEVTCPISYVGSDDVGIRLVLSDNSDVIPKKNLLLSVAVGDICGSWYELKGNGTKDWHKVNLMRDDTDYTDDTICAFACAEALFNGTDVGENLWTRCRADMSRGYGRRFRQWLEDEARTPYVSAGTNGSAMRCMSAGFLAHTEEECKNMAFLISEPTHNHPESIKGAEAVALSIYHLLRNEDKLFIRRNILAQYYPNWESRTYASVIEHYEFSCLCEDTVPLALLCFLESDCYENCLKMCIGTMGDSDTLAAMASPMAYIYYGHMPEELIQLAKSKLPAWMGELNEKIVWNSSGKE